MFDTAPFADLSADRLCEEIGATQARLREQEWRELALAAAWGDVHCPESRPPITRAEAARRLVHGERIIPAGGDGTPLISEFACAELGLLLGTGHVSGGIAIRDALNLRHRHPHLWALLATGHGRVWKARHVARMCQGADLTLAQTHFVDAATTAFLDKLAWSAFTRLIEAKIIEADPAAAEARRQAAALARFVSTGRCNEHGLKTLIVQANAGDVVTFVALCDRIAAILAHTGDTDTVDVRRSKAIGILANPAAALALLEQHATVDPEPRAPGDDQLDDQLDEPPVEDLSEEPPWDCGEDFAERPSDELHEDSVGLATEASDSGNDATPVATPDAGPVAPSRLCTACGGPRIDPDRVRPRAVIHVRITDAALGNSGSAPVASVDHGIGPVTLPALRDLLGHHHITVRPVLDVNAQLPVDAYEVPTAMREALHLTRLTSVFPWTVTSRPDDDHTRPYVSPDKGGPPGQTNLRNLGPLPRFPHRLKTHAPGWVMRQTAGGTYLWRTPHGYWFHVDTDGTHPLGRNPDLSLSHRQPPPPSPAEEHFRAILSLA